VVAVSDRKKIQPRVDAELWRAFRESVKERKGQTRGVLGDELDNAIREYLRQEERPVDSRIEKRLARIEEAVGAAPTDGGSTLSDADEHTHTRSVVEVNEKPPANAATEKKVAYLAGELKAKRSDDLQAASRNEIIELVKTEYGFRSDTAERYVERVADFFEFTTHPANDDLYVTPAYREKIIEQRREDAKQDADDKL
jgi:hypothetical protein